jgi:hypothetical protein
VADGFVFHSKQVSEPTFARANALSGRGFKAWYDVNLLPGRCFDTAIDDAIDRGQAFEKPDKVCAALASVE